MSKSDCGFNGTQNASCEAGSSLRGDGTSSARIFFSRGEGTNLLSVPPAILSINQVHNIAVFETSSLNC